MNSKKAEENDLFQNLRDYFDLSYAHPCVILPELMELKLDKGPIEKRSREDPPLFDKYKNREVFPIDDVLGVYDLKRKEIVIFKKGVDWASNLLNVRPLYIEQIVRYHEWSHATIHLGRDREGRTCSLEAYDSIEDKLHETLAQLWAYHGIKRKMETAHREKVRNAFGEILDVFKILNNHQPSEYRQWHKFINIPSDRIRRFTIALRNKWLIGQYDLFESLIQ